MNIGAKKLYRSRSNRMISGVCGGLGDFFGVDPTLIRLAYVFLSALVSFVGLLFVGPIIYIVLWIITPQEPIAPAEAVVEAPPEPPAQA
jgi:phage shock protein C